MVFIILERHRLFERRIQYCQVSENCFGVDFENFLSSSIYKPHFHLLTFPRSLKPKINPHIILLIFFDLSKVVTHYEDNNLNLVYKLLNM